MLYSFLQLILSLHTRHKTSPLSSTTRYFFSQSSWNPVQYLTRALHAVEKRTADDEVSARDRLIFGNSKLILAVVGLTARLKFSGSLANLTNLT